MKLQEHMINVTRDGAKEAFKYAKAVPADKLEWKPLENGRSVLDLCRELAMCPEWAVELIADKDKNPDFDEAAMADAKKMQEGWKTIEDCETECNERLEKFFSLMRELPDERLAETKWLPYDGGRDFTMPEMMDYPRWNFNYHLGQIAYIQTLYGDKEMH
ncbi:MAG: DinB family protein [Fimbriimonadales bacterium]